MEVAQTSRKHYIRQGSAVCSGNDEGAEQLTRNLDKALDSLSPSNGWADREDKPGVRTISEGLH